ncbi:MAG TPA: IS200/IS605 family transposase [Bacteroidales bacterium]|nr:IS200/IS605 family transposase [Bacteroidales bacterium]HPS15680.1 IS200/IS605 family transposase [Bacteroidales bacterium]
MANTYTQLNMHVVFAVKGRENLLMNTFRDELFRYISGILKNIEQFPLAVNGYKDHVHLFFELQPTKSLSDIIRVVKSNSSKWINDSKLIKGKFSWQEGYGGFSYSRSQRNNVIQYIVNQEEHHRKKTFREEYLELLKLFEIDFNEQYIFEFYD